MKTGGPITLLLIAVLAISANPLAAQTPAANSNDAVIQELHILERRMDDIEKRLPPNPNTPAADGGPSASQGTSSVAAELQLLGQAIQTVDRQREPNQDPTIAAATDLPLVSAGKNGFSLQSSDGDYRLAFGLITQGDGRFSLGNPKPIINTFTLRKVRPSLSGTVSKYFDFKVTPDFGSGTTVIQDAYFDVRFGSAFRVRTGKDKTPIGYELLITDAFLLFPERSLASSLVPNRDDGIQAQGDLIGGKLYYAAGVFNGIPDGSSTSTDLDTNNGKDLAGRVVLQPFKSAATSVGALTGLGFQVGGSRGNEVGALPSFKTSAMQTYFSYNSAAAASGDHRRVSPAIFYYYKGFGGFAEYMQSAQLVTKATTQADVTNRGWDVTASYILTGEPASDHGVRPIRNFDPHKGQWGALQLVARYSTLTVDNDAFTLGFSASTANREAKSYTAGLNWYPASFVKYYLNYERTNFSGGPFRPIENMIILRTQLAF